MFGKRFPNRLPRKASTFEEKNIKKYAIRNNVKAIKPHKEQPCGI